MPARKKKSEEETQNQEDLLDGLSEEARRMVDEAAQPEVFEEVQEEETEEVAEQQEAQPEESSESSQMEEMRDKLMRARAEAENTRRRAEKEKQDAAKYGAAKMAQDFISVLENLQRATDSVPEEARQDGAMQSFFEGVELTKKELLSAFEKNGIKRIEPQKGEAFDHNYHQAMSQVETPEVPAGAILDVMQAGYIIHDRLLRPAMVVVSKGTPEQLKVDTTA